MADIPVWFYVKLGLLLVRHVGIGGRLSRHNLFHTIFQ